MAREMMNEAGQIDGMGRGQEALTALRRIIRATEFSSRRLAGETGLTNSQLLVLRILGQEESTPGRIARQIGLTQATVTTLVDRLEARDLVQRRRGEDDRRRIWITLTEAGRVLLAEMPSNLQNVFQSEFADLADWEQAMIVSSLERIASMLRADTIEAGAVLEVGEITQTVEAV